MFQHLKGWQKIFGLIAFVAVVLIMINPEFLALGLIGDTAFLDMLVLALSLQMYTFVTCALRWCVTGMAGGIRWVGIPSPGFRYLIAQWTLVIGSAISFMQRAVHRISS